MLLAGVGSLGLMIAAYLFQHVGGMAPCKLCIWQRYPHVVAIALGAVALALPNRWMALLGALAAASTSGIGFYHAGVERGFWPGPSSCTSTPIGNLSTDDLLDQILTAPLVRCDDIPWEFLSLSMANWNGIVSLALMTLWLAAFRRASS